jgi:hypothetical protein
MAWPKVLHIGGMQVEVDSWDEVKEAYSVFGSGIAVVSAETVSEYEARRSTQQQRPTNSSSLSPTDRALLEQFVEAGARGVLANSIGQALGKRGKGIRPALEGWSRRIGLVTEQDAVAFESVKRFDGRGYRMVDHFLRAANQMLGR